MAGSVDAIQFGKMLGMMEIILSEVKEIKRDMKDNYTTNAEANDIRRRITNIENAPNRKRAEAIAIFACIFSGLSSVGTVVAVILR